MSEIVDDTNILAVLGRDSVASVDLVERYGGSFTERL